MGFIKKINHDFFIKNNQIFLSQDYLLKNKWRFKKITGSRLAAVLNKSKYTTPLKAWCIIVGIYKEEMDSFLMDVGKVIEPKILKFAIEKLKTNFLSYDPKIVNWDVFKNNNIFGGIPDGEPIDALGSFDYNNHPMLEIKTTSIDAFHYIKNKNIFVLKKDDDGAPFIKEKNKNYEKWHENNEIKIPIEYIFQLSLYLYLRKVEKGIFFICFLETNDYKNPDNFNPGKAKIEAAFLNIKTDKFRKHIDFAEKWYKDNVILGKSPIISEQDSELLMELDYEPTI